jgi:hypothetical protein
LFDVKIRFAYLCTGNLEFSDYYAPNVEELLWTEKVFLIHVTVLFFSRVILTVFVVVSELITSIGKLLLSV